jgi:nitrite reductase (NO-forming)
MSKTWNGAVAAFAATAAVGTLMTAPSYGQGGLPTERAVLTDAPHVPPPVQRKTPARVLVDLEVIETINEIADGVKYTLWTYGGNVPGKMIRVREGDTVVFKLINKTSNMVPHNIDLHSVTGPGGGAKVTLISPGEEAVFEWKAIRSGVYVYHCATAPVPMHISNGMFGLCVVEPAKGLPKVDREFYVMQSEFYTHKTTNSGHTQAPNYTGALRPDVPVSDVYEFSFDKMLAENPDYVLWNGRVGALTGANALKARTGEKVRFFVGNGGLNLVSSFHIIGDHLEEVYREGSLDSPPLLNVQNTVIPAGAAVMVDTTFEVPGEFLLVDHSLGRAFNKGGVGLVEVDGKPRPDLFKFVSKKASGDRPAEAPAGRITAQQAQLLSGCKTCHDVSPQRKTIVGPPLYGLFGQKPRITGVPFTKWDREALDEFLRDPSQVKPNTMMTYRVRENDKRRLIIDALEALK